MEDLSLRFPKKVSIEDYGFEIKYPKAYTDIEIKVNNVEEISSKIQTTITEIDKETDVNIEFVKELVNAKSELNGIKLLVEGIKKEKTPKDIETICKDYITMFKVYNEDVLIISSKYDKVMLDEKEAGRVEIYVEDTNVEDDEINGKIFPGIISYLISLDDREITVVFTGTNKLFDKYKNEINKIVDSIRIK